MKQSVVTRRSLVAGAAAAALTRMVPAQVKAATERPDSSPLRPEPPSDRTGYVVVGIGEVSSTQVIPALMRCTRSKLVGVVTGEPTTKGAAYAKQFGFDPSLIFDYSSFDKIKDRPEIAAVYIALPNSMHREFTVRAATAGKHVLCEKPMANSDEECTEMVQACSKAGKKLMIAYRQQYEPYNRELVRLYRSGELGRPVALFATNGQNQGTAGQWRQKRAFSGGGSLVDVGIYCLNAARFITGEEPVEITAHQSTDAADPRFTEVEDRIAFTLRFPSGVLANLMSFYSGHGTQYLRVTGDRQWAELNPAFAYHGLQLRLGRIVSGSDRLEQVVLSDVDQFANEIDHFSRCIQENRTPHTPGEEGRQDIFLTKAIYQAMRTGQTQHLPQVSGLDTFRGSAPDF